MEIRSYRRVFDLERRVYSIDRLRLNPAGVPVRGILYGVGLLCGSLLVGALPLLGAAVHALPWYLSDLALPLAGATVLAAIRIEGRTFHLAAFALMRFTAGPRRTSRLARAKRTGERWYPPAILLLPDGSDGRMRRLSYRGPGAALVLREHDRLGRVRERGARAVAHGPRPRLVIRERAGAEAPEEGQVIELTASARMLVRGASTSARPR